MTIAGSPEGSPATPQQTEPVSVLFTGDIGLTPACHPGEQLFDEAVVERCSAFDAVCVNLELPFTDESCRMAPYTHPSLKSLPDSVSCLIPLRPRVVNIGTNHCMDGGREGIELTRRTIEGIKALAVGAGTDETQAREPAFLRIGDYEFCFMSYCKKGRYSASGDRAGAALLSEESLRRDIPAALGRCDFLVVSLHMGMEFSKGTHPKDRELARLCVDLGASCVVGHHPHVIQGIEVHNGSPIFYSLGNTLFDNNAGAVSCRDFWEDRHRGLLAEVRFSPERVSYDIIPVRYTSDPLRAGLATGSEAQSIRSEVLDLSSRLAAGDDAVEVETRAVGAIARREIATILALTRLHGWRFVWYFVGSLRPRHLGMLWRSLTRRMFGR